jgi:hypothetical protein
MGIVHPRGEGDPAPQRECVTVTYRLTPSTLKMTTAKITPTTTASTMPILSMLTLYPIPHEPTPERSMNER